MGLLEQRVTGGSEFSFHGTICSKRSEQGSLSAIIISYYYCYHRCVWVAMLC